MKENKRARFSSWRKRLRYSNRLVTSYTKWVRQMALDNFVSEMCDKNVEVVTGGVDTTVLGVRVVADFYHEGPHGIAMDTANATIDIGPIFVELSLESFNPEDAHIGPLYGSSFRVGLSRGIYK